MSGRVPLRVRAAAHEVRCAECRVSWPRWAGRLVTPYTISRALFRRRMARKYPTEATP